jgi:hypothetical protein
MDQTGEAAGRVRVRCHRDRTERIRMRGMAITVGAVCTDGGSGLGWLDHGDAGLHDGRDP